MSSNSEQLMECNHPLYFEEEDSPHEWLSKEIAVFQLELQQMYRELYTERQIKVVKTIKVVYE